MKNQKDQMTLIIILCHLGKIWKDILRTYEGSKVKYTGELTKDGSAVWTGSRYTHLYYDRKAFISKENRYGNITDKDNGTVYGIFHSGSKEGYFDALYIVIGDDIVTEVNTNTDAKKPEPGITKKKNPRATPTPKTTTTSKRKDSDAGTKPPQKEVDYVLPESNSRYVTNDDISGMDAEKIQLAINEIYARRGRKFAMDQYQGYFDTKSWYKGTIEPEAFDDSVFNEYEKTNVDFLANAMNSLPATKSSTLAANDNSDYIDFSGFYVTVNDMGCYCSFDAILYRDKALKDYAVGDAVGDAELLVYYYYGDVQEHNNYYGRIIKQGYNVYSIENTNISVTVADNSVAISGEGDRGDGIYQIDTRR